MVAGLTVAAAVALLALLLPNLLADNPTVVGHAKAPNSMKMQLVDSSTSPFASVGGGPQTGNLLCATVTVCYADESSGSTMTGSGIERTDDGGATWRPTAALPDHAALAWPLSCPSAEVCLGTVSPLDGLSDLPLGSLHIVRTETGGASWVIHAVALPAGIALPTISQLSCPTAELCIAQVTGAVAGAAPAAPGANAPAAGAFMVTTDGGTTWHDEGAPSDLASTIFFTFHCDADGSCIGLAPTGSAQDPSTETVLAVRTTGVGAPWTTASYPMPFGLGILIMACGDSRHCIMAFPTDNGLKMDVAATTDGGLHWLIATEPSSWPTIAISLSCADGLNCFLSAADSTSTGGYADPLIEATHDGGSSWTPITLPDVDGGPLALVFPLSCPVPAGCIGVGATPQEFNPPRSAQPPKPGSLPVNGERVIVSNLKGSQTDS
jgi:hypothetical protein